MDLVTDFTESNKGNKHILTIIDLLTGWPEAIPIPNKSADTITKAFIRHYLPRHMCPWFILSNNGMEFKNQTFDKVTKDLGIERIFSAPYCCVAPMWLSSLNPFIEFRIWNNSSSSDVLYIQASISPKYESK